MAISIAQMFVTVGADVTAAMAGFASVESAMKRAGSNMQSVGGDLTKAVTAPLVGAGAAVVHFGTGFEDAFTRVRKTVDLSEDDMRVLEQGLRNLATTEAGGGKTAAELATIASVAGQVGIEGGDALLNFTRVVAQMSGATGLAEEQITTDLARIAAITNTPETAYENLASTIVALGNKMAGSEAEIIELTQRLAGSLTTVGVGQQDILGIASAMTALGINAEAGGTAISKFFTEMVSATTGAGGATEAQTKKMREQQDKINDLGSSLQVAQARMQQFGRNTPQSEIESTTNQIAKYQRELAQAKTDMAALQSASGGAGGRLEAFGKVAGVTIDQFRNLVQTDPSQAFVKIIEGISRIREAQGPAAALSALEDIGIDDSRMRDALLRLSTGSEVLAKGMSVANQAWSENTALTEENERAMAATTKQWALLVNTLQEEFLKVWDVVRGDVLALFDIFRTQGLPVIQDLVRRFQELSPEVRQQILVFAGLAAAIGPALFILGTIISVLGAVLSPIGLVAIAIGALAAAWITNFGGIRDKVMPIMERLEFAFNFLKELVEPLGPIIAQAFQAILPVLSKLGDLLGPAFGKGAELLGNHIKFMMGILGRFVSFNVTIWGLIASIVDRAVREIGQLFQGLLPILQQVGNWINENVVQQVLGFIRMIGDIIAGLGLPGVGDIGALVRNAELAIQQQASQIAAGGPGGAATNNVEVTINNPQVPDQTAAEAFAAQVQNAVINALIDAEKQSEIPPQPGLPGQPIMPSFGNPF